MPAGAPFDASTAGTYWAFSAAAQIIFRGLEADAPYTIDLFGTGSVGGTGIFTADGISVTMDPRNNNIALSTLNNVFADSLGNLTLDIAPGSGWSGINALSITAVPEPTSLCLIGVAGIIALRRRTEV